MTNANNAAYKAQNAACHRCKDLCSRLCSLLFGTVRRVSIVILLRLSLIHKLVIYTLL